MSLNQSEQGDRGIQKSVSGPVQPPVASLNIYAAMSNLYCPLLNHFEYTLYRIACSWPLCAHMTS